MVLPSEIEEAFHRMSHANGNLVIPLIQPHLKGGALGLADGVSVRVPQSGTCGAISKVGSSTSTFLQGSDWGLHRRKNLCVLPPTLSLSSECC